MRALSLLAIALLVTPVLSGCLGSDKADPTATGEPGAGVELLNVPEGATVQTLENGKRLLWNATSLPFTQEVSIPEQATLVQVTGDVGTGNGLSVHLAHADTGRRRCNIPYVTSWETPRTGTMTCSGLTAVDPLPANWTASVSSSAVNQATVKVDFLNVPIEGPAAKLNLSNLSMPTHDLQEVQDVNITSHDGTNLYAQVTLPEGEGPWPVIISSSPYNAPAHHAGTPSMWEYFVQDWAKRGYAVISADVRGTGKSGGCMEVWGPNEKQDQKVLVDWAREQDWSTGRIGFYGQSYVGTTPVEAAVQNPEGLEAIIAVAPVINAYDDWHFGGVPNGENLGSPAVYQASTGGAGDLDQEDPLGTALLAANGVCDPTLTAEANDPRAIYDDFYNVRNFSKAAENVTAATLYTHGFEDVNVKSQMITHFFNAIDAPKLAVLGHWVHEHPVRADNEVLFLAWMDHHVKGKQMGFDTVDNVTVTTNDNRHRTGDTWPASDASNRAYYPDFTADEIGTEPTQGSSSILLDASGEANNQAPASIPTQISLNGTIQEDTYLTGQAKLHLDATLTGTQNAHVAAFLYDTTPEEDILITFGMANLAHRNGHDTYTPVIPASSVQMGLPFLPTEYELSQGDEVRLVIRAAQPLDWTAVEPSQPGVLTLEGGTDGTTLDLPVLLEPDTSPRPLTIAP